MLDFVFIIGASGTGKDALCHAFKEHGYREEENVSGGSINDLFIMEEKEPEKKHSIVITEDLQNASVHMRAFPHRKALNFRSTSFLLDCQAAELVQKSNRFGEVRDNLSLKGLLKDAKMAQEVRKSVDVYIDTSKLVPSKLYEIASTCHKANQEGKMAVVFSSFGHKHGLPMNADLVFDCRVVPNPYWVDGLRELTGKDFQVKEYLESQSETVEYRALVLSYLTHYLAKAQQNGKKSVFVYFGCTGGQHRSVYFAEWFHRHFLSLYPCVLNHRELDGYNDKGQAEGR